MKLPKEIKDKRDMGVTAKTRKCSVKECQENAIRSLPENTWKKYIEKAGLKLKDSTNRRIFLCKPHYAQSNKFKKSLEKKFQKKGFLDDSLARKKGQWEI